MHTVIQVTQSFEFSASHRLYCSSMSEDENRQVFGKCANKNGHGHNYVVEVTTCGQPHDTTGTVVDLASAQRVVKDRVIDRFDHKHLNHDCEEFRSMNPSVENIARVVWDRLHGQFGQAELARVRVWETPKTYAEYDGED
jgi:6-pyruvoyltetrahydropterin/6-carboxytetrahydropterin synthase